MSNKKYQPKSFAMSDSPIITPSTNIIGSTPKKRVRSYEEEKEYNNTIKNHHEMISKLEIKDNFIMVRLYKYDSPSMTEGGIIIEDVEEYTTEGGKKSSRRRRSEFRMDGIVALKASNLENSEGLAGKIQVGDTVHLAITNSYIPFPLNKEVEKDKNHGYVLVHVAAIDCIVNP